MTILRSAAKIVRMSAGEEQVDVVEVIGRHSRS